MQLWLSKEPWLRWWGLVSDKTILDGVLEELND